MGLFDGITEGFSDLANATRRLFYHTEEEKAQAVVTKQKLDQKAREKGTAKTQPVITDNWSVGSPYYNPVKNSASITEMGRDIKEFIETPFQGSAPTANTQGLENMMIIGFLALMALITIRN